MLGIKGVSLFDGNENYQPIKFCSVVYMYACLATLGHGPKETTDGVLGYPLTTLDQGITASLDSVSCILVVLDGLKHNVTGVFCRI